MNAQEFIRTIGTSAPAFVYLFCPFKSPKARAPSFEPVLAERAVERLVQRYVDPTMKDLCYSSYYAEETDPSEVRAMALTVPFLAEYRVIVVQNAEHYAASESAAGPLLSYIESPCDSALLILVASQIDKRSKFYRACEKNGQVIECPELRDHEAAEWIRAEVEARDKTIAPAAIREILARTGTHLGDANNAVAVVCNYVGQAPTITAEDVVAACADVAEEEIWALTDAIAQSNTNKAVRVLREILALGKSEFEIMGSINWLLKSAYAVARGGPNSRVREFVAQKVAPLAAKIGLERFRDAFSLCMDTEILLRSTGVDRALALELLVIKLAAPGPRARREASNASRSR